MIDPRCWRFATKRAMKEIIEDQSERIRKLEEEILYMTAITARFKELQCRKCRVAWEREHRKDGE